MLGEKVRRHGTTVWLVNTGCAGGPHSIGDRIDIACTRAMVHAALTGQLDTVEFQRHTIFNIDVPVTCPGIPTEILDSRRTWPDGRNYDRQAMKVARMFVENFKAFERDVPTTVKQAGPTV
jgi:phosphoenolpyruvate carboxykinase (ATP)